MQSSSFSVFGLKEKREKEEKRKVTKIGSPYRNEAEKEKQCRDMEGKTR